MQLELQSMAIAMPRVAAHPNRAEFRGVLTLVGVPSDKPPAGARGHRVMLTREATERALPSLLGMGLDYAPSLDRHDARRKVGVITEAELNGAGPAAGTAALHNRPLGDGGATLEVSGFLYAKDFPDVMRELRSGGGRMLGMSYEIADARVAEVNAVVWEITEFTFTGAALLRKDKAAYRGTWIELIR
ncbi:MAG: hypothetical protein ACE14L_17400 [Terriglobales bacterium]